MNIIFRLLIVILSIPLGFLLGALVFFSTADRSLTCLTSIPRLIIYLEYLYKTYTILKELK